MKLFIKLLVPLAFVGGFCIGFWKGRKDNSYTEYPTNGRAWIDSVSPPLKSETDDSLNVKTLRIVIDSSVSKIDTNSFRLSKKPINSGKPHKAKKGSSVRPIKWVDLSDVNLVRADTFWTFRESSNGFGAFGFYQPPGYSVHLWGVSGVKHPIAYIGYDQDKWTIIDTAYWQKWLAYFPEFIRKTDTVKRSSEFISTDSMIKLMDKYYIGKEYFWDTRKELLESH